MRDLSTVYKTSASSDTRSYSVILHVWKKSVDDNGNISFPANTEAVYTSSDSLISMSIVDGQTSGNSFQLGQTFCPIISFSTVPNLNIKTGDKVQVELVFTSSAKAILATGYVDEYSYDSIDYAVSYMAYGKMLQLDKDYNSALTYPATFSAVVNEICSQNGLTFDTFAWKCNAKLKAKPIFGNLDNGEPAYASAREMLGIIAGVNGCNVVIGADEKVKFVPYTDTKTGITYEDAFSRQVNNEKYIIKKAVLNDGGQTTGDEAGYVELYFPLETVEGKASCLEKLNSVITGLSVMGMTVQTQGKGYYEIGDVLSYTDFDGEKYTIGVMGIKYDFGGGYFTETLYSLAPSEMEEQYKGNVRYSSASTTLKNPIVLSENTSSYLQYNYTVIGYRKGDKLTEAEGSKSFFIGGYKIANDWAEGVLNGNAALSFEELVPTLNDSPKNLKANFRILQVNAEGGITWTLDYSYFDVKTGENVVHRGTVPLVTTNGTSPMFLTRWQKLHSPSETYPYGYAELRIDLKYYDRYGSLRVATNILLSVISSCNPCFTSIAEYNAAINLTSEPLIAYDVSQEVMQIVEGDTPADLPEYGNSQTLYLTTNPAASWKYDVFKQKYVCVGRNYRELQRIKSSTEESTALEVFNVPVIFDCRTKTEWELEANTVYPKGFMIFEQEADTREVTKLKIANGIDKLSNLKYTNVTEETDPTVPAWAKAENKPTYTASEVGLGNVDNTADIDKPVSTATQMALDSKDYLKATEITGQTIDLNDIKLNTASDKGKSQRYFCASASAQNISNRPVSVNEPFELTVDNIRHVNIDAFNSVQRYTSVIRKRSYTRWCDDNIWRAWMCDTDIVIYGTVTAGLPKSFDYATYGEGYNQVEIEPYYDSNTNPIRNRIVLTLTSATAYDRDVLTVGDSVEHLKIENGTVTMSLTGTKTLSFMIKYTNKRA